MYSVQATELSISCLILYITAFHARQLLPLYSVFATMSYIPDTNTWDVTSPNGSGLWRLYSVHYQVDLNGLKAPLSRLPCTSIAEVFMQRIWKLHIHASAKRA